MGCAAISSRPQVYKTDILFKAASRLGRIDQVNKMKEFCILGGRHFRYKKTPRFSAGSGGAGTRGQRPSWAGADTQVARPALDGHTHRGTVILAHMFGGVNPIP